MVKVSLTNNEMLQVSDKKQKLIANVFEDRVLMNMDDDQWVRIDIIDGKYVITMCGNRDGVECERKSFTFENGKIVKSDEPT